MVEVLFLLALAFPAEPQGPTVTRRVHDVRALLEPDSTGPSAVEWPTAGGPLLLGEPFEPGEGACLAERARRSSEDLLEVLNAALPEALLSEEGASVQAGDSEIVSVGKPELQAAVEEILGQLRATLGVPVSVEVALVPPGALPRPPPEGPFLPPAAFEECLDRSGKVGRRFLLKTASGRRARAHSGGVLEVLGDTKVNQTGVLPVVNPVKDLLRLGPAIEVEPLLLEPGGLRLEIQAAHVSTAGEPRLRKTHYADLELQSVEEKTVRTTLFLPFGRTALAGSFVERGDDGNSREMAVLVRAQPATAPPAVAAPSAQVKEKGGEPVLLIHDLRFLVEDLPGEGQPLLDPEGIQRLLRQEVHPQAWGARDALSVAADRFLIARSSSAAIERRGSGSRRAWSGARARRRCSSSCSRGPGRRSTPCARLPAAAPNCPRAGASPRRRS